MSEEKKCLNREELPEGVTELSMEDLEQVTGGAGPEARRDGGLPPAQIGVLQMEVTFDIDKGQP